MFYNADDDENDFMPASGRSKLASLFGLEGAMDSGGNESLTYKAPTEPKKRASSDLPAAAQKTTASPSVLTAAAVFAYKYVDNQYASQGKLGAAVIGSHTSNDFKILLYQTKEKPIAFAQITTALSFVVQPNNYATFYDDARQNWSVMFESEVALVQFVKQVALSRANSVAGGAVKLDSLIVQDLTVGEGPALELGDSVEIKYSGWSLDDGALGSMFDSSDSTDKPLRFRIGKVKSSKVWETGVIGMRKGGRRLVVVPLLMPYDCDGKIGKGSPESVTVFELEVTRVKFVRDRSNEVPLAAPTVPSFTSASQGEGQEDEEAKPRKRSLTDQPPAPVKPDKAKLISRMAKMGQSMLPQLATPLDTGDVEVPATSPLIPSASPPLHKPDVPVKPVQHQSGYHNVMLTTVDPVTGQQQPYVPSQPLGSHLFQSMNAPHNILPGPVASSQLAVYQPQQFAPAMPGFPQYQAQPFASPALGGASNQMYHAATVQPAAQVQAASSVADPNLPMMLMETRQQNTEVRVSLSKLADKVDRVSDKLDHMSLQQNTALSLTNSLPTMEVNMLVHSIQKIVTENERMKKELLEKSSHIDGLNVKILELIQQNQVYVEQSNALLEQRNVSYKSTTSHSQARVLQLEQEKVELATRLSSTSSQLADCQLEITGLKKRECELKLQMERLLTSDSQSRDDLGSLKIQLADTTHQLEQTTAQLRDEQQQRKQLHSQIVNLEETVNELNNQRQSLEKNLSERKKRSLEESQKLETEMKEMQSSYEQELQTLKERLKHEKNSTELTNAQQISRMEEDLERQWKEKCERLQSSLQDKHQRELLEMNSEKNLLEDKVKVLENKIQELKTVRDSSEQQIDAMKDEMDELRTWKEKYDNLRAQAVSMKQRYEDRISELIEETSLAEQSRDLLEQQLNRALDAGRRLQAQLSQATSASAPNKADTYDIQTEVKKVMNSVYRRLRAEFSAGEMYEGSDIHAVVLDVVKTVTLEAVQPKAAAPATDDAGKQSEPVVPTAAVEEQVEQSTVLKQEAKFQSSEPADSQPAGDGVNEVEGVVASLSGVSRFEAEETSQEPLLGSSASEGTAISETGGSQPTEEDNAQLTTSVGSAVQETNNADVVNVVRTANNGESFSGAPEITVSSSADVRSAESDDKPTDDELSISTMQDQTIEQTADSELAISSPPDRKMENRDGEELSTSPLPQDKKIESGDDDGLFFTDARSEVSEYDVDVDADQKQSPEVRNLSVVDIQVQEVESGQKKSTADVQEETDVGEFVDSSSIPPAILASTAKPKSKTSIFDDDDDDDDLFSSVPSNVPSKKISIEKTPPPVKGVFKPHRTAESDEDVNREPPPLFGNSDSEDDEWMK